MLHYQYLTPLPTYLQEELDTLYRTWHKESILMRISNDHHG